MDISISIPDEFVDQIKTRWDDLSRGALESLALEAFRAGVITEVQVQRMLGLPACCRPCPNKLSFQEVDDLASSIA